MRDNAGGLAQVKAKPVIVLDPRDAMLVELHQTIQARYCCTRPAEAPAAMLVARIRLTRSHACCCWR